MVKKIYKALACLIIFLIIILTGCDATNPSSKTPIMSDSSTNTGNPISTSDVIGEVNTNDVNKLPDSKLQDSIEEFNFLESDGDTQYAWRFVDDNCVLYAIDQNDTSTRQLAVFPPLRSKSSDYFELNYIVDFGICDDWIIVSVGHYAGSGHYFYGDFARLEKDGSALEHFWLTDDDTFVIIENWIYYNFWEIQDNPKNAYGCYRVRPDGTGKEYLGDTIHKIHFYSEDGYVYGDYATENMVRGGRNPVIDLIRCKPDGSDVITLMKGESLPEFENSDFIKYYDIETYGDTVLFTVGVHGYSEGDSWRGHYVYTAWYRVNKDGSGLTLLREQRG